MYKWGNPWIARAPKTAVGRHGAYDLGVERARPRGGLLPKDLDMT